MTKISELIGKPVISIIDAQIIGTISNVFFNEKMKKCTLLSIFDDEVEGSSERFVELSRVVSSSSDAAVIKDSIFVSYLWNTRRGTESPINLPAFTQEGRLLGTVNDIVLEKNYIKEFIIDGKAFPIEMLLSFSSSAIILNDSGKKIRLCRRKKIPLSKTPQKIELHYEMNSPPLRQLEKPEQSLERGELRDDAIGFTQPYSKDVENSPISLNKGEENAKNPWFLGEKTPNNQSFLTENNVELTENSVELTDKTVELTDKRREPKENPSSVAEKDIALGENSANLTEKDLKTGESSANLIENDLKAEESSASSTEEGASLEEDVGRESVKEASIPLKIPRATTNAIKATPKQAIQNNKFDFLIGKLLEKNILDEHGNELVRAGSIITPDIIALCKKHVRLVQLALHSTSQA